MQSNTTGTAGRERLTAEQKSEEIPRNRHLRAISLADKLGYILQPRSFGCTTAHSNIISSRSLAAKPAHFSQADTTGATASLKFKSDESDDQLATPGVLADVVSFGHVYEIAARMD